MAAVVGRPNAGKSTLVNRLLGVKVSIVSDKPQTTRRRLLAVLNRGNAQVVLMDTPGFHKPQNRLGDYMVRVVRESMDDVDAAVLVVEPVERIGVPEELLLERIAASKVPAVLVINKVDAIPSKEKLLGVIALYAARCPFASVVPLSALSGEGTDALAEELRKLMPEGPALFPEDMATDQPEKELISELVREKLLGLLQDEIPHGVAVAVETLEQRPDGVLDVGVVVFCEKARHKGMIIGKNGAVLKKMGELARVELEELFESKVYLHSWVRVQENWRDNANAVRNFGYE
jgi:GTP-binding protein Era